jgi:hypothetical protein
VRFGRSMGSGRRGMRDSFGDEVERPRIPQVESRLEEHLWNRPQRLQILRVYLLWQEQSFLLPWLVRPGLIVLAFLACSSSAFEPFPFGSDVFDVSIDVFAVDFWAGFG